MQNLSEVKVKILFLLNWSHGSPYLCLPLNLEWHLNFEHIVEFHQDHMLFGFAFTTTSKPYTGHSNVDAQFRSMTGLALPYHPCTLSAFKDSGANSNIWMLLEMRSYLTTMLMYVQLKDEE